MIQNHKLKLAKRVSRKQIELCQKEVARMPKSGLKNELRALLCELQTIKQIAAR